MLVLIRLPVFPLSATEDKHFDFSVMLFLISRSTKIYLWLLVVIISDRKQDYPEMSMSHHFNQIILLWYVFRVQLSHEKIISDGPFSWLYHLNLVLL